MEEEDSELLRLFDRLWFHHLVLQPPSALSPRPPPLPPPAVSSSSLPLDHEDTESHASEPPLDSLPSFLLRRHRRPVIDEAGAGAVSSDLVIRPPMLHTILSGKVAPPEDLTTRKEQFYPTSSAFTERWRRRSESRSSRRRRNRKKEEKSKSLTDLEFEELKGLMDLGFTFSDAETDPRLMDIVPGLQRLGRRPAQGGGEATEEEEAGGEHPPVERPYLSEAWDMAETAEEKELLRNWRIPAAGDGVDLKDHLRFWARAVASTVR